MIETSWQFGSYTVRLVLRFDNPYWPKYAIQRGDKLVGYSFSMVDANWCASVERRAREAAEVIRSKRFKLSAAWGSRNPGRSHANATRARRAGRIFDALG